MANPSRKQTWLAWRYLWPGVIGMLLFVALPLAYTVRLAFTNYSSGHLLAQDDARAYLLAQRNVDIDAAYAFTLHEEGGQWRVVVSGPRGEFISPALAERADAAQPLQALPRGGQVLATAADLRTRVAQRDRLQGLALQLPDGSLLTYAGLREFAPAVAQWRESGETLVRVADGAVFSPNLERGRFISTTGEMLQPGFKVNVGWRNYARLFGDADLRGPFMSVFVWTLGFSLLTVVFSATLGTGLAVALNWEALPHRTLLRTLLFLPYAVPGFISILVFKGLFNQNFGEINAILNAVFGIKPAWFADPDLARLMLLIVNTWLGYPYFMVLATGVIKAIPADLYEASALAGAGPWVNFRRITAPLIVKPLTPLLISAFAFNFNNFVLISLLTDGRPDFLNTKLPAGTTDILVTYTYRIAFTDAGQNFGLAAAISTLIFLLVAVISLVNLRFTHEANRK
jgi:maltose/maltodextrin transport system permease protein